DKLREVLNLQLFRLGVSEFIDGGISHYEKFEIIFNVVMCGCEAHNTTSGDIGWSQQLYAGVGNII
ncbi:22599_t:CDS:2, partial [Racocetra persica]